MNATYACPQCREAVRVEFDDSTPELVCPRCSGKISVSDEAVEKTKLSRCLACPSTDLYVRKDFPQRLGVALVGLGIVGSSIAWAYTSIFWTFGILFATALADVALYTLVGESLMCYRCSAQYRGVDGMDVHGNFDLETHERYRQLAARLDSHSEPQDMTATRKQA